VKTFDETWEEVRELTLLNRYKARLLHHLAELAPAGGDGAECGVFRGGAAILMADAIHPRIVWAYDGFQGLPEERSPHETSHYKTGHMAHTLAALLNTVRDHRCENIHVVAGWFRDTMQKPPAEREGKRLSIVHVDCDLYWSTRTVLELLYPQVMPGGIMVFDDYADQGGGVAAALNDHLRESCEVLYAGYCDQVFLVKRHTWDDRDREEPWLPPGKMRRRFRTREGTLVDSTIPATDRAYLRDLDAGRLTPELPGGSPSGARSVGRRLSSVADYYDSITRE
jgi:hypothetical protein